jgi:hypothetical protein
MTFIASTELEARALAAEPPKYVLVIDDGDQELRYAYPSLQSASDGWAFHTLARKERKYFSMTMWRIVDAAGNRIVHQQWEAA